MDTLLLDTQLWDLCLDARGNIALATDPYSVAQDVASAVRTFLGECWYHTNIGIPYFDQVLGHRPPVNILKALIIKASLAVPGCTNPVVFITSFVNRKITGQIQFTDSNLTPSPVFFISFGPGLFTLGGQIGGSGGPIIPGSSLGGLDIVS